MTGLIKRAMKSLTKRKWTRKLGFASSADDLTGEKVGIFDAQANGRFDEQTGQLAVGFTITAEDTVVDIGCGEGGISSFAAKTGAEVIATDIDPGCVQRTRHMLAKSKARAFQAHVSDSAPLPLADGIASRVITSEVLEHVLDPAGFLTELVRIGKPGALYLITMPAEKAEQVQKVIAPPAYWAPPNHVRILSAQEMDKLVVDAGLTIESHSHNSFFWAMWWVLFWAEDRDLSTPEGEIHRHWVRTWKALLDTPKGDHVRRALDNFMPKNQVIVARKPL